MANQVKKKYKEGQNIDGYKLLERVRTFEKFASIVGSMGSIFFAETGVVLPYSKLGEWKISQAKRQVVGSELWAVVKV